MNVSRTRLVALAALLAALSPALSGAGQTDTRHVETLATLDIGSGGLTVGPDGTIYVADFGSRLGGGGTGGDRVLKVSPAGEVALFATGLKGASGNEMGLDGNLYQSNIGANLISQITPTGQVRVFASEGFASPVGIASDAAGNLYVVNCGDGSIQRLTPEGISSRFVQSDAMRCPNGITGDESGNFYVANFYNGDVLKVTPDGEVSVLATLPGNNNGHLIYHAGALYVVARGAHQIYRVGLDGEVSLIAGSGEMGGNDGDALQASFIYPNDIGVSPDGRYLYVNDVAVPSTDGRTLAPTRLRRIELQRH